MSCDRRRQSRRACRSARRTSARRSAASARRSSAGIWPVAGCDEAGRGPLAGPVVAAAVILDPKRIPRGLNDSKKLTPEEREKLYAKICASAEVAVAFGSTARIDRDNILRASLWALARAVRALPVRPKLVFVDGRDRIDVGCDCEAVISGDALVLSIAAASIVAKVTRDRLMVRLGAAHPGYGFERHMGYSVPEHFDGAEPARADHPPSPLVRAGRGALRRDRREVDAASDAGLAAALPSFQRRSHSSVRQSRFTGAALPVYCRSRTGGHSDAIHRCCGSDDRAGRVRRRSAGGARRHGSISLFVELLRTRPLTLFWAMAALQAVLWTLVPALFYSAPPGELPVVLAIGHEFQLGTDFGPPLAFWLAEIAYRVAGMFGVYLLSQICIVVTYWAVLSLGRAIVGDAHAVMAVLLMAGIAVFSVPTPEFGPAILATPLWALILLHYWRAIAAGPVDRLDRARPGDRPAPAHDLCRADPDRAARAVHALSTEFGRDQIATTVGPWIAGVIAVVVLFPYLIWLDLSGGAAPAGRSPPSSRTCAPGGGSRPRCSSATSAWAS